MFPKELFPYFGIEICLFLLLIAARRGAVRQSNPSSRPIFGLHWVALLFLAICVVPVFLMSWDTVSSELVIPMIMVPQTVAMAVSAAFFSRLKRRLPKGTHLQTELDLTPDRLPTSVWTIAGIPLFTAALIYWLSAHWNEFTSIYGPDASPIWHQGSLRTVRSSLVMWCVFGLWNATQGIAMWYGSPRTAAHRAQFSFSMASAWFMPLFMTSVNLAIYLELSWTGLVLCALGAATGIGLLIGFGTHVRKVWKAAGSPMPVSHGWYADRDDPSMWGPRGTNMGNPWQWALMAGGVLPVVAMFLWR
ncbi:MAG: DUF2975 domain-containing protein [Acidobacteriota bacterium]